MRGMSQEAPFTTFLQWDDQTSVPAKVRVAGTFTVTRLQSTVALPDRITKVSPVPALLVSVTLKSLPPSSYKVWAADKLFDAPAVQPFRSNVVDFAAEPSCWAGCPFDFVHYSVPRDELDGIAEDFGLGRVDTYRPSLLEEDPVVAQITKSIVPFVGRNDEISVLALDQFGLILGAHLLQRYGILQKRPRISKGGLAPWQKRRAAELLHENMQGRIRLAEVAGECGLSVSHFARSFKISFGTSTHQWLTRHRIDYAKQLMIHTNTSLTDVAIQSGFSDQPAFTRTFHDLVGAAPGKWRREMKRRS
jgi:AraC family transcriptional regulator